MHRLWIYPGFSVDYSWIFVMASQPLSTSTPSLTFVPLSPAVDVSAHHSCQRCARRMSSFKYDKHTVCNQCRHVNCAVDVKCSECSSWTADIMQEYLEHRKSLVLKGRKKPALATPSSSPSPTPVVSTVSSLVSRPAIPTVSDDQRSKIMFILFSLFFFLPV